MRALAMTALVSSVLIVAAGGATAQTARESRLTLADPARAPATRLILDGASWRCEGETCTASGGASQPAERACRRVVARLGAVTAFTWQGRALDADQLAVCNAAA
jgi:hypothetical protein